MHSNALAMIARHVIISQTEDIDFLTICEMADDLNELDRDLTDEEHKEIADMVSTASVEIVLPYLP